MENAKHWEQCSLSVLSLSCCIHHSVPPSDGERKVRVVFPSKWQLLMKISCTEANNANFQHGWCGLGAAGLWGHCTPFWVATISFSVNPNRLWWFSYIQFLRACQREQIFTHCTMVKLKNGIKSSQLWTIISPPIFNGNLSNFERWWINIQKII